MVLDNKQLKLEYKKQKEEEKKQYTLLQWYEKFKQLYKINIVKDTTIIKDNRTFFHLKKLHNKLLTEITAIDIQEAINKAKGPTTKINMYLLINAMLEKAKNNDLLLKNVCKQVNKPKYKAQQKIALTLEQEKQFIENCKKHIFGNYFLIALYQGLRRGECKALKVNDIDFENNTLRIDESINAKTTRTTTKNETSNRTMPLFKKSKAILTELVKGKKQNDFIFDIKLTQIDNALENIVKGIKSNQHITPHILRHTFITRCQELNIPLYVIQAWVGHEKGSVITTKIYTHLNTETNSKFANLLDEKQ